MKKYILISLLTLFTSLDVSAVVPAEWKYSQDLRVAAPGLAKARLPLETLGTAQPSLADLRLLDSTGKEIPFLVDQPAPEPARDMALERMIMTMEKKKTVITGAVPAAMRSTGFEAITLFTPTVDFLKPITLEGSPDGKRWTPLLRQAPIFKQTGDATSSTLRFSKGNWSFLRITLDDSESPPLRVSAVRLFAPSKPNKDLQEFEPQILEIASDAHRTEIRLQLPASGLSLDAIRFDVPDTTFRRQVHLASREFSGGEFREIPVNQGSIYRITMGAQRTEELTVPIGRTIPGPLVTLTIENGDSPALTIGHVWTRVLPRDLIFDAPSAGVYQVCSGNSQATPRDYDVVGLRDSLSKVALQPVIWGPSQVNAEFKQTSTDVSGDEEGSDIDTDPWRFRKKVTTEILSQSAAEAGLYRIELDLQAIAHNEGHLEALRLVRHDKQLPYVMDYAGVERNFAPAIASSPKLSKGKSQWEITLPYAGIPISQLRFTVPETLFQRNLTLYEVAEELPDRETAAPIQDTVAEGVVGTVSSLFGLVTRNAPMVSEPETTQGKPMRILATATWTRTRADGPSNFDLTLQQMPKTQHLILETDNGDNAAIHPMSPLAYYQAPRLLFRSRPSTSPLYLYYGQPEVSAPQYDLNLIAAELLSTPPQEATLGAEQPLKATRWWEVPLPSTNMRYIFWIVMGLVVAGLLLVIAKLLPAESDQHG